MMFSEQSANFVEHSSQMSICSLDIGGLVWTAPVAGRTSTLPFLTQLVSPLCQLQRIIDSQRPRSGPLTRTFLILR